MDVFILKQDNNYLSLPGVSDVIARQLDTHFSYFVDGAQFSKPFKEKVWDGRKHHFNKGYGSMDVGLLPRLIKFLKDNDYTYQLDGSLNETSLDPGDWCSQQEYSSKGNIITPFAYQQEGFDLTMKYKRRLLLSPTSSGKSLMVYMVAKHFVDIERPGRTLILVPKIGLVNQLFADFEDYSEMNLWDVDEHVQLIGGKHKDKELKKDIVISTWQSAKNQPLEWFESFTSVICDEVHEAKAKEIGKVIRNCENADVRIGLTGTLDNSITNQMTLEGLFGSVSVLTTNKERIREKTSSDVEIKVVVIEHADDVCKEMAGSTYQDEVLFVETNKARNAVISKLASKLKGNTLVMFTRLEHGKLLFDLIQEEAPHKKVYFIAGEVDADERERIRKEANERDDLVLVGSYGTMSTGISINRLINGIFASSSKSKVRVLQSIGRFLRLHSTKDKAFIFDIADDLTHKKSKNYGLKHLVERLAMYASERFKYNITKMKL